MRFNKPSLSKIRRSVRIVAGETLKKSHRSGTKTLFCFSIRSRISFFLYSEKSGCDTFFIYTSIYTLFDFFEGNIHIAKKEKVIEKTQMH